MCITPGSVATVALVGSPHVVTGVCVIAVVITQKDTRGICSFCARVFLERGGTLPLRPLPLGIVVTVSCVTLGVLLLFVRELTKLDNFPCISATTIEWEHNPRDFQFGQLESELNPPLFVGVTICGTFPL